MADSTVSISVVYALPEQQTVVTLAVRRGTTVAEAVALSGFAARIPELASAEINCAIFGRAVPLSQQVVEGDRVEVLRRLLIDPKENRRQTAARARGK
jgi:uncharacterized protein